MLGKAALGVALLALALSLLGSAGVAVADARPHGEAAKRAAAINFAKRQVGKPYVWGGTGPRGYDCSGLMVAAYRSVGKALPRTTYAQLAGLRHGGRLKPGDLVFGSRGHVALYIGNGKVVSAPGRGRRVEIQGVAWHLRYTKRSPF